MHHYQVKLIHMNIIAKEILPSDQSRITEPVRFTYLF